MQIDYQLTGTMVVPEGSRLNCSGTEIILPDGMRLKVWEAWESQHADVDDYADLTSAALAEIGVYYDTLAIAFEET